MFLKTDQTLSKGPTKEPESRIIWLAVQTYSQLTSLSLVFVRIHETSFDIFWNIFFMSVLTYLRARVASYSDK